MTSRLKSIPRLLVVTAALLVSIGVSTAAATDRYLGEYAIQNVGTGRCLDAFYSYGGFNGNPVGLWACNGGITELWHLSLRDSDPTRGIITVRNARNWRSLDYPASSAGSVGYQYELWDFFPSAGQLFVFVRNGGTSSDPQYIVLNKRTVGNYPMDAFASGGGGNGNPVGTWYWNGSALQHWRLVCYRDPCSRP